MRRTQHQTRKFLWPALVAAGALSAVGFGVQAAGEASSTSTSSNAELQRGVPGIDVDLGTTGMGGVPGIDVDVGARGSSGTQSANVDQGASGSAGVPGTDVDLGASSSGGVPGVDVDLQARGGADGADTEVDTRAAGAGPDMQTTDASGMRMPIQDRN